MDTGKRRLSLQKALLKLGLVTALWIGACSANFNNLSFIGLQEWLLHRVFGRSERRRTTCPSCTGTGVCANCEGKGCPQCRGIGRCAQCHGEGNLVIGSGDQMANG